MFANEDSLPDADIVNCGYRGATCYRSAANDSIHGIVPGSILGGTTSDLGYVGAAIVDTVESEPDGRTSIGIVSVDIPDDYITVVTDIRHL